MLLSKARYSKLVKEYFNSEFLQSQCTLGRYLCTAEEVEDIIREAKEEEKRALKEAKKAMRSLKKHNRKKFEWICRVMGWSEDLKGEN